MSRFTAAEQRELMVLAADAYDAEGEARVAACTRIGDWFDAVPFTRARRALWRRQARREALVSLLRETNLTTDEPASRGAEGKEAA